MYKLFIAFTLLILFFLPAYGKTQCQYLKKKIVTLEPNLNTPDSGNTGNSYKITKLCFAEMACTRETKKETLQFKKLAVCDISLDSQCPSEDICIKPDTHITIETEVVEKPSQDTLDFFGISEDLWKEAERVDKRKPQIPIPNKEISSPFSHPAIPTNKPNSKK